MCFKYLKNGLISKFMVICQFWTENKAIQSLRLIKDSCMEIFCSIIKCLLCYNFHDSEFVIEY